jgi:hypothetical protein
MRGVLVGLALLLAACDGPPPPKTAPAGVVLDAPATRGLDAGLR